jgi:hypothetical protein
MEDRLPGFVTPVRKIYDGYQKIMETKRRGDSPLAKQLHTKFGIERWEWTRLKVVYELALAGNEHATGLVKKIDAGKITVSAAYGELSRTLKDETASVHLPQACEAPRRVRLCPAQQGLRGNNPWANAGPAACVRQDPTMHRLDGSPIGDLARHDTDANLEIAVTCWLEPASLGT